MEDVMKGIACKLLLAGVVLCISLSQAEAHFGTIVVSDDIVSQEDSKKIAVEVKFIHPMELHYMEMVKPERFGVLHK